MNKQHEPMPTAKLLLEICASLRLSHLEFVRKMENIVYRAHRDGEVVYLRLTSPLRRKKSELIAELHWIEFLKNNGLPVVNVIENDDLELVKTFVDDECRFEAVMFRQVLGRHPEKNEVGETNFLHKLGSLIATMHLTTEQYKEMPGCTREHYNNERGFRHAEKAWSRTSNVFMRENFVRARDWLQGLEKNKKNYGLIHADIASHNLFIDDKETIHVIDFDDSCYHWQAFDLALVIYHLALNLEIMEVSQEESLWLTSLVDGYRRVRALDDVEIANIPRFIEFATLRLYFWIEDHQYLQTFTEDAKTRVLNIKSWAEARIKDSSLSSCSRR